MSEDTITQTAHHIRDLIDGIKIMLGEGEWVLVLPDPDFPRFHVHAEASNEKEAQELADRYVRIVQGLQE